MTIETLIEKTFNVAEADTRLAIADAEFLTVFLSLKGEARAARWRGLDHGSKFRLVARQIEALGYDWMPSDVEAQIAKYDETYASDIAIPAAADLLVVAKEQRADAVRQHDTATVRQLDRVIVSVACGARIWWDLGDLYVASVNNLGAEYVVSCGRCTCPATKPCWHMKLWDILLDMLDTAAGDADMEADADDLACDYPPLGSRIAAARTLVWGAL